jgi:hypothetical protein
VNRDQFIDALEEELHRRRVQFNRGEVRNFVNQHWTKIHKDPDLARWAKEFLDSGHGSVSV